MNSPFLKKALPHIIAIVLFLVVAIVYCKPALQGMIVNQQDTQGYKGMAQQSVEYRERVGHFPLWSESMFGGMPAYTIAIEQRNPISMGYLLRVLDLGLPSPISLFFIACVCMYILTQVLRINPWLGALASLAYAYSTYSTVIVAVGHVTKMMAMGYAPGVIASLILLYNRKWLLGAALMTCFFFFQVATQHLQVVYYTMISAGFLTLYYLIDTWKEKRQKDIIIGAAIAAGCCAVGFMSYAVVNLPTAEYAKDTMRGGRTLLTGASKTGQTIGDGGLSKEYAFNWSYGIPETITLLIPNGQGGGGDARMMTSGGSKFADKLTEGGIPEDNALAQANYDAYWGGQPNTAGAVYLGAVCWFLFILGLVYVKGWRKWWLVSVAITGVVLAWGSSFATVNNFLFDHLPFYNKFRAPTIAMVMPQFALPLLGAMGLDSLLKSQDSSELIWKKFKNALIITAGLLVVAIGFYFMASYKGGKDVMIQQRFTQMLSRGQNSPEAQQQASSVVSSLMSALRADRQSLYASDLIRTIVLIGLAAVLVWLYVKGKYKQQLILLGGMLVLSSFDLLAVGRRYLTDDSYIDKAEYEASIAPPSRADEQIKADPEKGFRVYDEASGDPYNSSRASYHHNSVGGYSPAKMGLYQDLIEHQLSKGNMQVFDMLNTKYFLQPNPANGQPEARINPGAYGACWLVKNIHYVDNGNQEMQALDSLNLKDTVIVNKDFKSKIKFEPVEDSTAKIALVDNRLDTVDYKFSGKTNQFAVFSEIYYDKGWKAFIDGQPADYVRVDYVLRGMSIPAGEHAIQWRFEPHSYQLGDTLSGWFSLVGYLLLILAIVSEWKKSKGKTGAPA